MQGADKIVIDWGTSSLRAWLVTAGNVVVDSYESQQGIHAVKSGYEQLLDSIVQPWIQLHGQLPVFALGMITSRNGWHEVPYVACPASAKSLANGVVKVTTQRGLNVFLLPGVTDLSTQPFPDVMRGEETQIIGFHAFNNGVVVLPGTHSKWAQIQQGSITRFQTYITGELFGLLSTQSFVAGQSENTNALDVSAFERGVSVVRSSTANASGMLSQLFSVRTGLLAGELHSAHTADYLSGMLLAQEFAQAEGSGWFTAGDTVGVIANNTLSERYALCAQMFDLQLQKAPEHASLLGAASIARYLMDS